MDGQADRRHDRPLDGPARECRRGRWLAITPVPSAAGVSAKLNGGPYTFSAQASNSKGASNIATITIDIAPGAASLGNEAISLALVGTLAGFQGAGGNTILLSTGAQRTAGRNVFNGFAWASPGVTLQHADPSRPAPIGSLEFGACAFFTVSGITCAGSDFSTGSWNGIFYIAAGSDHITLTNCGASYTNATQGILAAVRIGAATNITTNNFLAVGVNSGVSEDPTTASANVTHNNFRARYFTNNFVFLSNGTNWTFSDCVAMSPVRNQPDHLDHFQIAAGATPANLAINRFIAIQADGNTYCQGPPFITTSVPATGYISGTTMTITVAPVGILLNATVNGAGIAAGTKILSQLTGPSGGKGTYQVSVSQTAGSAGSPISIYSVLCPNLSIDGMIYCGRAFQGITTGEGASGTTFKNFTMLKVNSGIVAGIQVQGSISGTTLTVVSLTGSQVQGGIAAGMNVYGSGVTNNTLGPSSPRSAGPQEAPAPTWSRSARRLAPRRSTCPISDACWKQRRT